MVQIWWSWFCQSQLQLTLYYRLYFVREKNVASRHRCRHRVWTLRESAAWKFWALLLTIEWLLPITYTLLIKFMMIMIMLCRIVCRSNWPWHDSRCSSSMLSSRQSLTAFISSCMIQRHSWARQLSTVNVWPHQLHNSLTGPTSCNRNWTMQSRSLKPRSAVVIRLS